MVKYVECERDGYTRRGMLHVPEGASRENPVPMVIILHGFTGDKCESKFIHVALSRKLCAEGIASVRFDFVGSGESDGEFADMTLLTEVEDTLAILKFVKGLDFVDKNRIALHGMSQGGMVAFLTAARHPEEFVCLSTWSPALCIHHDASSYQCQEVSLKGIDEQGYADFHGLKLGAAYRRVGAELNVYEEAPHYRGPVQIVHGDSDLCVPYEFSVRMKEVLGDQCNLVLMPGGDHSADSIRHNEMRYSNAVGFLKKHLLG